jgi:hypothetical protein
MRDEHGLTPREKLDLILATMLINCRQALRIATEMGDQSMAGFYAEMEKKLARLVGES